MALGDYFIFAFNIIYQLRKSKKVERMVTYLNLKYQDQMWILLNFNAVYLA